MRDSSALHDFVSYSRASSAGMCPPLTGVLRRCNRSWRRSLRSSPPQTRRPSLDWYRAYGTLPHTTEHARGFKIVSIYAHRQSLYAQTRVVVQTESTTTRARHAREPRPEHPRRESFSRFFLPLALPCKAVPTIFTHFESNFMFRGAGSDRTGTMRAKRAAAPLLRRCRRWPLGGGAPARARLRTRP